MVGRKSNAEKTEGIEEEVSSVMEVVSEPKKEPEGRPEGPFSILVDGYLRDLRDALEALKPGDVVKDIVAVIGTKRGLRGKGRFILLGEKENSNALTRYIYATSFDDFHKQMSQMTKGEELVKVLEEPINNKTRINVNRYYLAVIVKR